MTIATILANPSELGWVHDRLNLEPSHFWFPFPRAVFEAMIRIQRYGGYEGITFSAVQREVERKKGKALTEQFRVLHQLLDIGRINEEVLLSFVREVRNRARLRELEEAYRTSRDNSFWGEDAISVAQGLIARLNDLVQKKWRQPTSCGAPVDEVEKWVKKAYADGKLRRWDA